MALDPVSKEGRRREEQNVAQDDGQREGERLGQAKEKSNHRVELLRHAHHLIDNTSTLHVCD